jgi:hypothetical protein
MHYLVLGDYEQPTVLIIAHFLFCSLLDTCLELRDIRDISIRHGLLLESDSDQPRVNFN